MEAGPLTLSLTTILLLAGVGMFAGVLGALVGIGGGVVLVPVLSLAFGIDVRIAVATSLVSVIATSTAAGGVYVGSGLTNMRLGMALEVTTTLGGITGGLVAVLVPVSALQVAFGLMLIVTSLLMLSGRDAKKKAGGGGGATIAQGYEERGALAGAYFDQREGHLVHYRAERLAIGSAVALLAGAVSGMLGVGGGFLKVPAMNLGMRVPIRVAAATSNFMIGVTAVASLVVYFARGYVHPTLAAPVVLGVVVGSLAGTRLAQRVHPKALRYVLAVVLVGVALQMLLKGSGLLG